MSLALSPKVWVLMLWISTVMCHWDIRLTCPEIWYHGKTITLSCELNKESLTTKCKSRKNYTDFKLNSGKGYTRQCLVNPVGYANCNTNLKSATPACTCQENTTYFSFLYQFTANKSRHNGRWTCIDSCQGETSAEQPLSQNNSEYCKNVNVIDRDVYLMINGGRSIPLQVITYLLRFFVLLFIEVF